MALSGALALSGGAAVATPALAAHHERHVMQGITVKQVQRALHITADGVWGPQTERAVKRFQRRHGLEVDGVVGPQTARALGLRVNKAQSSGSRSIKAELRKIAQCESGGDPRAVSASGTYRGKYQFDRATWRALGGRGDPAKASEAEQDRRAAKLLRERGTAAWPNCA